ncbi:MBL fold metallo-hydrolase [Candidatus Fermentibacteria bacterium]|nr:MAG: MBL fold metallo-hydrolase [Candidatus Fermentibacteria bacterium]
MLLVHYFMPKLAHSSYMLAGNRTCAVIDPSRDVDGYIRAAADHDLKITHVLLTHLHADFVSGHMDLAAITGASVVVPASACCAFDHIPVSEGDSFLLEDMKIDVIETPGHTPEHVSYIVSDTGRGPDPAGVFCGDTLFVGDVGRPDLFPDMAGELASRLYDSLRKLMELPDFCEVYPAHGAGSLCGRSMGSKWRSTIGYERRYNAALQIEDRDAFIQSLTTGMPPAPDHFSRCSAFNRAGPATTSSLGEPEPMKPEEFRKAIGGSNSIVLDVRRYDAFGGQHIPDAVSIDFEGNIPVFAGWVLPPDADIYLVATNFTEVLDTTLWLRRVGLDRVMGYLDGGMFAWSLAGLRAAHLPQLSVIEADLAIRSCKDALILDVRSSAEYDNSHIDGAVNIPAPDLRTRFRELDQDSETLLVCSTGYRSALAGSILLTNGFGKLQNVSGGMKGFNSAALAPACLMCSIPHGPRLFTGKLHDQVAVKTGEKTR